MHEVLEDASGNIPLYRFRYVADGFNPADLDSESALADTTFLCEDNALPQMQAIGGARGAIISLADREAPFGVLDTTVQQIFEAFSIDGDTCIWEAF